MFLEKRTLEKALEQDPLDISLQEHPTVHIRLSGQDCIRGRWWKEGDDRQTDKQIDRQTDRQAD